MSTSRRTPPPPRRAGWSGGATTGCSPACAPAWRTTCGVDVTLVRVLTLLGTLLGFGSLLVVYVVLWVLLPQE